MHWAEQYIGQPYITNEADCARLVTRVRSEVFKLPVPTDVEVHRAASRLGRAAQMTDLVALYTKPVDDPKEGDVVLMLCRNRPSHVGVYCDVNGEPSVLHAMENAGMVVLHRIRDLPKVFLSVEGFYKWK
jgi:cell wall-associated NlpC family hydrolase